MNIQPLDCLTVVYCTHPSSPTSLLTFVSVTRPLVGSLRLGYGSEVRLNNHVSVLLSSHGSNLNKYIFNYHWNPCCNSVHFYKHRKGKLKWLKRNTPLVFPASARRNSSGQSFHATSSVSVPPSLHSC